MHTCIDAYIRQGLISYPVIFYYKISWLIKKKHSLTYQLFLPTSLPNLPNLSFAERCLHQVYLIN